MSREIWSVPKLWDEGTIAVIIAGGPSLTLSQVRHVAMARLENKCRVIAINDAVFIAWWADWLHACDYKWWDWHRNSATKFPGIRTTCTEMVPPQWAHYLEVQSVDESRPNWRGGFVDSPSMLAGGGGSGYQGIELAVKAGASTVILLGFDMKRSNGQGHWFGEHPDRIKSDYETTMLNNFPSLAESFEEMGIKAINATPDSAIDVFPRADIETLL